MEFNWTDEGGEWEIHLFREEYALTKSSYTAASDIHLRRCGDSVADFVKNLHCA